jgi:hypothetical protein
MLPILLLALIVDTVIRSWNEADCVYKRRSFVSFVAKLSAYLGRSFSICTYQLLYKTGLSDPRCGEVQGKVYIPLSTYLIKGTAKEFNNVVWVPKTHLESVKALSMNAQWETIPE